MATAMNCGTVGQSDDGQVVCRQWMWTNAGGRTVRTDEARDTRLPPPCVYIYCRSCMSWNRSETSLKTWETSVEQTEERRGRRRPLCPCGEGLGLQGGASARPRQGLALIRRLAAGSLERAAARRKGRRSPPAYLSFKPPRDGVPGRLPGAGRDLFLDESLAQGRPRSSAESENQRRCLRRPEEERNNEAQDTLPGGLRERGSSTRAGAGRLGDGTRRLCREGSARTRHERSAGDRLARPRPFQEVGNDLIRPRHDAASSSEDQRGGSVVYGRGGLESSPRALQVANLKTGVFRPPPPKGEERCERSDGETTPALPGRRDGDDGEEPPPRRFKGGLDEIEEYDRVEPLAIQFPTTGSSFCPHDARHPRG
ncbi:hypothetical protein THAOC_29164 [Thalassiosira oceanica]|uniref:Uncharacterized protein n=1 Tax=Thalassiosira oceanica TaxID=159749 RepID=K0RD75_THAOC|nr:hypothetical protein THAOC_29164 [Thalassiosira oceanica]|eukprot:EJK51648.1 hypothetical protein THAOC_29164 [Thalassiosira oceanica]